MSNKRHPTYSTAKTASEILEAVARAAWWKEHNNAKCPQRKIPREVDLRDFVIEENQRVENALAPPDSADPSRHLDLSEHAWRPQAAKLMECVLGGVCRLEATANVPGVSPDVSGDVMILAWVKQPAEAPVPGAPGMLSLSIPELHGRLQALPKDLRPPQHPLEPLVKAWQERPASVKRNARRDRTMPSRLGMVSGGDNRAGKLFNPAMHLGETRDGGQLVMSGFAETCLDIV